MTWLINNWTLLVVLLAAVAVVVYYAKKFAQLPTAEQQEKIKAWLLAIVIEAERQFGEKTGQVKLSWVYAEFVKAYPALVSIVPFKLFSTLVDEVLDKMRNLLESNESLQKYVKGE